MKSAGRVLAAFAATAALALATKPTFAAPAWRAVPNTLSAGRWAPAACTFDGGRRAIIAGGYSYGAKRCVAGIDLFSERLGRFRRSKARLAYPVDFACANLLADGDVLIAGGFSDVWASMNIAQLYDPRTDTCRPTAGRMCVRRELFQAVNLEDGTVLLTGGLDLWRGRTTRTAEIYHPISERFTPTAGEMVQDRFGHAACRLLDGRVLIVGGTSWNLRTHAVKVLDTAEIYSPSTQTFRLARGRLDVPRDRPTATLLPTGKVLIFGGQGPGGKAVTTAELFDPVTELFTVIAAQALEPRMAHSAVALPRCGDIVIAGGWDAEKKATTPTSLEYDWRSGRFVALPNLPFAAHDEALLALWDGSVLAAGGKIAVGSRAASCDRGAVLTAACEPSQAWESATSRRVADK